MTITGRQIRGARGILGWTMEDLTDKSGVNRITIRQIESEEVQPQEKTLAKIHAVLDRNGIEFLEDDGVKLRKGKSRVYLGKTGFKQFLDLVYETLEDGGIIRQFNFGDLRYLDYKEPFVVDHLKRMSAIKGLDAKVLEGKGETAIPVAYCEYRLLDGKFKDMAPWYVFGENIAISLHEEGGRREFMTIQSRLLAERYMREFDIFWNMAAPKKGKAK